MALFAYLFAPYDMVIIGIIALLFFGNRLPTVMRSLGEGVTEFKKGLEGKPDDDAPRKLDQAKTDEQPLKG